MTKPGNRVLVTGAAGFIGSHLVESLVRSGRRVRAFVTNNSKNDYGNLELLPSEVLREVEVLFGDVRDPDSVDNVVKGCDTVFHLAAMISVAYSFTNPVEFVQTNVLGTSHVLMSARKHEVERIVHTSSSEVYGTAQFSPISESHPLCAQSPYAASKIGADMVAQSFFRTYDLPVVTLRPFNNFGPRQSARAIIPTVISQALARPVVKIGSRKPRRDFLYVGDTVRAYLAAEKRKEAVGQIINLGTGKTHSIADVITTVEGVLGRKLKVEEDKRRFRPKHAEVHLLVADAGLAKKTLGWRAETPFTEGIRRTIDWTRDNLERFKPGVYTR